MTDRPILFSAEMVRAILKGEKTQTRRIATNLPPPPENAIHPNHERLHPTPYLDAYCSEKKTPQNPRGMSTMWCWWTPDNRMGREFRCRYGQPSHPAAHLGKLALRNAPGSDAAEIGWGLEHREPDRALHEAGAGHHGAGNSEILGADQAQQTRCGVIFSRGTWRLTQKEKRQ